MTEVAQTTDLTTLPPGERAVIALGSSKAEAQIQEYLAEAKDVTAVTDKTGRELAHKVGMKLKNARTSIEKIGKAAREDAQAFSKAVIEEEKRLKGLMADEEDRIFKLRDEFDAKEKAEKEAKERAERERVEAIQAKIDAILALPSQSVKDSADDLVLTINDLDALMIDENEYQEFAESAATVLNQVLGELRGMLEAAKSREAAEAAVAEERARLAAEAERLAAERAELDRMRAEIEAMKAEKVTDNPEDANGPTLSELIETADPAPIDLFSVPADPKTSSEAEPVTQATDPADDADALVRELATYTSLQFQALSKKVAAVMGTDEGFAKELAGIGEELARGGYNPAIKRADWTAMADADKEMALASHACVSLILGDEAMGASVLRHEAA